MQVRNSDDINGLLSPPLCLLCGDQTLSRASLAVWGLKLSGPFIGRVLVLLEIWLLTFA